MRAGFFGVVAGVAGALILAAVGANARPLTPAEKRYIPYYAQMPKCGEESVLLRLQARFEERESKFWKSGLEIRRFEKIRETAFRKNGLDYIPRRYCEAKVVMNDHKTRPIYYSVIEDQGMTGGDAVRSIAQTLTLGLYPDMNLSPSITWGVDWCIVGLDRNYAYALNCKAARP